MRVEQPYTITRPDNTVEQVPLKVFDDKGKEVKNKQIIDEKIAEYEGEVRRRQEISEKIREAATGSLIELVYQLEERVSKLEKGRG
jgi:hypothetical protein